MANRGPHFATTGNLYSQAACGQEIRTTPVVLLVLGFASQKYKAHKVAVTNFTIRVQQLGALQVRVLEALASGKLTSPPQLEVLADLLKEAKVVIEVSSCRASLRSERSATPFLLVVCSHGS